ncbi:hypothetical protein BIU82_11155 [Arthrobacter sp. SW1]|uniref:DUF2264 domain-containing protein n=1 Tax=Arthrobacter sp. SW1 TaxID=1920889 RepID=UPI000877B028|nr:DUF2264 domain-containing protein [Arthrobacter sp. SW1]OFI36969.1 hypothetical protein BIU82_11155 [Arthrobacter sp. SW1]
MTAHEPTGHHTGPFELPEPDFETSPITGWTRAHWLAFADQQLLAARQYFSPGNALIRLPGRPSWSGELSDGLEGFARTFMLAAFRVAGEQGADPHGHLGFYREGLLEGTRPGSAEAWPAVVTRSQPIVEAASVALGLQLTKPWLWDSFSEAEQRQVAAWLQGSNSSTAWDNNWVLFQVLIAEFLAGVGLEHNEAQIEYGLSRLEDWYAGGGWYRDGDNDGTGDFYDYYCGWALHLYPVLWAGFAAGRHPSAQALGERYAGRLAEFLPDHALFFAGGGPGGCGSPVFQGRSLIYRYAAVAPLFLGYLAGDASAAQGRSPLTPGQTRRIASGAAKFFLEGGAYPDGLPALGWLEAFGPMVQDYSGPASPFWTSKAFVGLLLPATHPVWTAVEEPSPVETADQLRHSAAPNYLLHSTASDGIARVLNHGSDKYYAPGPDDPHYRRLAYSSHTAPLFTADPVDNHFAVLDGSGTASRRSRIHRLAASPSTAASWHAPVWSDVEDPADSPWRVASATTAHGGYELRVHVVERDGGTPPGAVRDGGTPPGAVREGGYALAGDAPPLADGAVLSAAGLHSAIWPVHGYSGADTFRAEGASPLGRHAACGVLAGELAGSRSVFASLVYLGGAAPELRPGRFELHDDGTRVSASLTLIGPDGELPVLVIEPVEIAVSTVSTVSTSSTTEPPLVIEPVEIPVSTVSTVSTSSTTEPPNHFW